MTSFGASVQRRQSHANGFLRPPDHLVVRDNPGLADDTSSIVSFSSFEDNASTAELLDEDDENTNTQTIAHKFRLGEYGDLDHLFREDKEADDYLHDPNEKAAFDKDKFWDSQRNWVDILGLLLMVLGILYLFIGYPAMIFYQKIVEKTNPCPNCLDSDQALLANLRSKLVDPDTPSDKLTVASGLDGKPMQLAFSDEFERPGRTFYPGDDPYWEAVELWYSGTLDLQWYDPDALTTKDGQLQIRLDAFQSHNLNYRSGMLQSWNKFCFQGGRLETRVSLPGRSNVVGFWPAVWMMGNLGRPGYPASNNGLWPYSYEDKCDAGIAPNQSSTEPDFSHQPGLRLPACTCPGEDHPTPGKSRGAPEIDLIEATVELGKDGKMGGRTSQTFQVAPFDPDHEINKQFAEIHTPDNTEFNKYTGTPYQEMISALSDIPTSGYDGNDYVVFAVEYHPGADGKITWFMNDQPQWTLNAAAIGPIGSIGQRIMPEEPMALILNLAISSGFSQIDFEGIGALLPALMRIDYVRVYQPEGSEIGCDPPGYETTQYIESHKSAYSNSNFTVWGDTEFPWPKNSYVHGC